MLVYCKKRLASLSYSLVFIAFLGCEQQTSLPNNNDFSYLEPESSKKPISFKEQDSANSPAEIPAKGYRCSQPDTDLNGVLNKIEYYGPPGYGKTPAKDQSLEGLVLRLEKNIEVNCGTNGIISTREVLLEIPKDISYEYLLGGKIIARGQLEFTGSTSGMLPIKMQVLRMQSVQPSLQ